jgi:pullulanase
MPFGAEYSPNQTVFRLWAPQAVKVLVQRFATGSDEEPGARFLGEIAMQTKGDGIFSHTIHGNLRNQYYQYQITDCSGAVTWSADPWALAAGVNGKRSMVVDLETTDPPGWDKDRGPRRRKCVPVIWETHVRDFSSDPHSGVSERNRGKYLGFTEESTYDATDTLRAISSNVCVRDLWTDGRLRRLVKWHRNAAERN